MYDHNQLRGIVQGGASYMPNIEAGFDDIPEGIKDMIRREPIDGVCDFWGVPKGYKNYMTMYTRFPIEREDHIKIIEDHFTDLGQPIPGGYLSYKIFLNGYDKGNNQGSSREQTTDDRAGATTVDSGTGSGNIKVESGVSDEKDVSRPAPKRRGNPNWIKK